MATSDDTTRRRARTTRRAFNFTALAAALGTDAPHAGNALYAALSLPKPVPWGDARTFLSRFHATGAAAVTAAEGALATADDCRGVYLGDDRVLRIVLPGGIAVSQLGVETFQ